MKKSQQKPTRRAPAADTKDRPAPPISKSPVDEKTMAQDIDLQSEDTPTPEETQPPPLNPHPGW